MRLTNSDRDAFVRAVMDDVPKIDYDTQAMELTNTWAIARMPEAVRKMYETHPDWVTRGYVSTPSGLSNFNVPCASTGAYLDDDIRKQLEGLVELKEQQNKKRCDLHCNVRAMIYGCSTLKQAKERLPEFAKYLPQERDGQIIATLPAVANVVTDLMAAGWPKSAA